jgi:hypothetical protein
MHVVTVGQKGMEGGGGTNLVGVLRCAQDDSKNKRTRTFVKWGSNVHPPVYIPLAD